VFPNSAYLTHRMLTVIRSDFNGVWIGETVERFCRDEDFGARNVSTGRR